MTPVGSDLGVVMAMAIESATRTMLLREVNDRIGELLAQADWGADAEFVCECGRTDCHRRMTLRLREIQAARRRGRPLLAPECPRARAHARTRPAQSTSAPPRVPEPGACGYVRPRSAG
jgi:hypothetical protein